MNIGFDFKEPGIGKFLFYNYIMNFFGVLAIILIEKKLFHDFILNTKNLLNRKLFKRNCNMREEITMNSLNSQITGDVSCF